MTSTSRVICCTTNSVSIMETSRSNGIKNLGANKTEWGVGGWGGDGFHWALKKCVFPFFLGGSKVFRFSKDTVWDHLHMAVA